jgi:hypothetical protein
MPSLSHSDLEDRRNFLLNGAEFPVSELAAHAGKWIAWSPDGSRIVAHADDPEVLDDLVRQAGEDPQRCIIEGIPEEDAVLGFGNIRQTRP